MRNPDAMQHGFVLPHHMTVNDARALGVRIAVELDGEPCLRAVEFDTRDGWLRRIVCDDKGQPLVDGLGVVTERVAGQVAARIAGWL